MQDLSLSVSVEHNACCFASGVHEQHIDGRFKELVLHALRQHLAIPMIILAGCKRIFSDYERAIAIDRCKNDGHLKSALEKNAQDLSNLLGSILDVHHPSTSSYQALRSPLRTSNHEYTKQGRQ